MTDRTRINLGDMSAVGEAEGESLVITDAGDIVASGVTGGGLEIQEDDAQEATDVNILNFEGGLTATDEGGGKVTISGGSSLEVQESDVEKVTDVTVLNFEGGAEVTDEGSGKATITISGGAGGAADFSIWMPEAPPATAYSSGGTDDDEFDDASFDTGMWTEFDVASTQTVGEDEYGVYMTTTSNNHIQGIFQACPTGSDWSFTTYVGPMWDRVSQHRAGIILIEDTGNLSTSDVVLYANYRGGAGYGWQVIYHTDYDSWSADDYNSAGTTGRPLGGQWMRVRSDATNWYFDYSTDGRLWVSNEYSRARRFDVQGVGVGHKFDNSALTARFPFARFKDDSDKDQMLYGDRVNMWRTS